MVCYLLSAASCMCKVCAIDRVSGQWRLLVTTVFQKVLWLQYAWVPLIFFSAILSS